MIYEIKESHMRDMKPVNKKLKHANLWELGDIKLNGYTTYCSQVCVTSYPGGLT